MNIFENSGDYAAKWGLSDFYEEDEKILREALASGENFEAEWGCKKEIHYATLEKSDNGVCIEARVYIDELEDLLDTAIWRAAGGNDVCTCGWHWLQMHYKDKEHEAFESLTEIIWQSDFYQECFTTEETLPREATFEDIVNTLNTLSTKAEKDAEYCYNSVVDTIKWWMEEQNDCNQETPPVYDLGWEESPK